MVERSWTRFGPRPQRSVGISPGPAEIYLAALSGIPNTDVRLSTPHRAIGEFSTGSQTAAARRGHSPALRYAREKPRMLNWPMNVARWRA